MDRTLKAGIIGAGVAGMATAIRLACMGYEVTVYEANDYAGGKLTEVVQEGYRFDAGPSLFTLPELVDELIELVGDRAKVDFEYERLPVICHYFYEDGTRIEAAADPEIFAQEMASKLEVEAQEVLDFLAHSATIYDLTASLFLERSLHKARTYLLPETMRAIAGVGKIDAFRTMNGSNEKRFKDARLVQLFNRYATYNGSNPYSAPATLNIIPHLEFNKGAYFPKGGMHEITKTLVTLAKACGVTFHFGTRVDHIVTHQQQAKGIRVRGKVHFYDVVVSNMDVYPTYKRLLPQHRAPERILEQERSSSALIFYWGMNRTFPALDLHNIVFSKDYAQEFACLFERQTLFDDPTVYINISSKYQPSDAPEGGENWFTMINAPANVGQNWDRLIEQARHTIVEKLERVLGTKIKEHIVCESILDPRSIESKTSSYQGSLYGTSSNNRLAAFFRHPNFSRSIKGLYFCGGSVHPGGGIPLCLLSARIVSEMIQNKK